MKDMIKALEWRYAVKKFDETFELSSEQIHAIKQAFNLSASSYGLQPYELYIIQNKDLKAQLSLAANGQKQPIQAAAVLVFCVRTDFSEATIDQYFDQVSTTRGIDLKAMEGYKNFMQAVFHAMSPSEIINWSTKQAYLSMGTLLSTCAILGIDSCPMEGFKPEVVDQILDLESKHLKSVLLMPVGKRSAEDGVSQLSKVRKPLDEIITEIF